MVDKTPCSHVKKALRRFGKMHIRHHLCIKKKTSQSVRIFTENRECQVYWPARRLSCLEPFTREAKLLGTLRVKQINER